MSRGMPGLTRAALKLRVPKSSPRTLEAALAVVVRRKRTARHSVNGEKATKRRRPGGSIVKEVKWDQVVVCLLREYV